VTSGLEDRVLVLAAADGRLLDSIPVDRRMDGTDEPHGIAVAPDGRHWYVTLSHGSPTLWKFELPGDRLVGRATLETSGAARVGITPDSRQAFVPDYHRSGQGRASHIAVVGLEDMTVVARPAPCAAPHHAEVDPAGRRVAVTCSLSDEIVVLDAATLDVTSRFFVGVDPGPPGRPAYKPLNLVWSADGSTLYVGLFAVGLVRSYDIEGETLGTVPVGAGPAQLALTRDGGTLVVANRNDASVSLLDVPGLAERQRVALGRPHPHGVALDAEGRTAFVTYEGDTGSRGGVVALDVEEGEVSWAVEAGIYTLGIAYATGR
jgi:DNA-binding beta-propeller fold protein YncE